MNITYNENILADFYAAAAEPRRILLIDDNSDDIELIKHLIRNHHCELDVAQDSAQGVKMAVNGNYQLTFCDVKMPTMDGVEVVRLIKNFKEEYPVVALSGNFSREVIESLHKAGCVVFAHKPECMTQEWMNGLLGTFLIPRKKEVMAAV